MTGLLDVFRRQGLSAFLIALMLWVTAGPVQAASNKPDDLYSQIISAWQARDADKLAGLYAQGGSLFTSPGTGQTVDAQGFKAYLTAFFTAIPDFRLEVRQVDSIAGNQMVDQWTVSGTWKQPFPGGPLAGIPATGKRFVLNGSSFHQLKEGRLVSTVQYFDNLSFLTQIGAVPAGKPSN